MTESKLFDQDDSDALGQVSAVDTATVTVHVTDIDRLRRLQVNRLVYLHSSRPGEHLIGIVHKIVRLARTVQDETGDESESRESGLQASDEDNTVKVTLIGTHVAGYGDVNDSFSRTLETVPEIDACCFAIEGNDLSGFMQIIASVGSEEQRLELGVYTLDKNAYAYLNGDKFFQRHALIVGSTGAGKSWTVARIVEQVALLTGANALLLDIHGEYSTLAGDSVTRYRIAGPNDLDTSGDSSQEVIYLPFWLLDHESLGAVFVDRSDQNAPNQRSLMSNIVLDAKLKYLFDHVDDERSTDITIDSPIPFDLDAVLKRLEDLDHEMVEGARGQKQGPHFGRLTRLIERLGNKRNDRRMGFMFEGAPDVLQYDWLEELAIRLLGGAHVQSECSGGVKVIDFSEVPSDVLPLMVSLVARLAFSLQQWAPADQRHPIALFCDEAHLYMPNERQSGAVEATSNTVFERIAKEGRKYGIGLVVISQRPSEVNRTVLSQCNNFVSMRLTNAEDQGVVRRLLPDSLGGFVGALPVLDTGEALVVGDASLLPTRIFVSEPEHKPRSATVDFWSEWSTPQSDGAIPAAVENWRRQTQQ
ncbi:ATP-binding protein [Candidatus Poriferisodalis sp.]|uniref:ATP-binding protein n=1 Tax=Candidatus Poriferisodalis sp. TaxID=3101277 RepID=UPI003B01323C